MIIVGAGFAGLSAAVEAKNAGARPVILEKTRVPGGNSIISDGGIAAPGTDLQQRHGIQDSPGIMYSDMLKAGLGLNHPALLRTVTEQAAGAFLWTRDYLGVEYLDRVDRFGGHSLPRCYTPAERVSGAPLIKALMKKIRELEIPFISRSTLTDLLVEESTEEKKPKRICGVITDKGVFRAAKGVILACGGFGADTDFRRQQDPRLDGTLDTTNKPFATAEGLKAALRHGALPVQLSHIQLGAWASPDEKGFGDGPLFADYIGFLYGLIVHPDTGQRYVNEQTDRKTLADKVLEVQKPSLCFSDEASVRRSGWDLSKALKKGVLKIYPSLAELARAYHLPRPELEKTVERFNRNLEAGTDPDFQRVFPDDARPLQPPFYAMKVWPKVHYTMGGLGINDAAEVLSLEGDSLPGLYAAGEITGGIHGACRLGSCAITDCLVFGRIAGRNAAAG